MKKKEIDIEEMIEIYRKSGENVNSIVKAYGIRHDRAVKLLMENGENVVLKERKKSIDEELCRMIVIDYQVKLLTITELSKKYHMDSKRVSKLLKDKNIPLNVKKAWKNERKGTELTDVDKISIIKEYEDGLRIELVAKKHKVGKKKVEKILDDAGIDRQRYRKRGKNEVTCAIENGDYKKEKYIPVEGHHYVAVLKEDENVQFKDHMNLGGFLTRYIKERYNVESTLYERRKYYIKNGNYWWEQWFDIKSVKNDSVKTCPYCDWETIDTENKGGSFELHIMKAHGITPETHLAKYPVDSLFFKKYAKEKERNKLLSDEYNYVTCPICGEKMQRVTHSHLMVRHNMSIGEFNAKYAGWEKMSDNEKDKFSAARALSNLSVNKNRFISKAEREISEYLTSLDVKHETNRQILCGREIDIIVPDKKIGIEYDGLVWHSEWFGKKDHRYHLEKTNTCNKNGYGLIHIFEDEFVEKKELVLKKISHILGISNVSKKIMARKCEVSEIKQRVANDFLEKNHIQGGCKSTLYYGCFHEGELVGVMAFLRGKCGEWDLNRFATNNDYICVGVGGKMFRHFINENRPMSVKSFADRRWTVWGDDNIYTKLGFKLEGVTNPNYSYFKRGSHEIKRFHKFGFRKQILSKKYGFPLDMTETEMVKELGYDRIWDCGLFKYVWRSEYDLGK